MKIKDIITATAALLNQHDVIGYLEETVNDPSAETLSKIDLEMRLLNLVLSELAAGYVPMVYKEEMTAENGKIEYADLKYSATRILSIEDASGEKASYVQHPSYIEICDGVYTVEYEHSPASFALEETVNMGERILPSLIAYGVAAEYCITQGRFEEAVMWRKRYSEGVERVVLPDCPTVKGRCWL